MHIYLQYICDIHNTCTYICTTVTVWYHMYRVCMNVWRACVHVCTCAQVHTCIQIIQSAVSTCSYSTVIFSVLEYVCTPPVYMSTCTTIQVDTSTSTGYSIKRTNLKFPLLIYYFFYRSYFSDLLKLLYNIYLWPHLLSWSRNLFSRDQYQWFYDFDTAVPVCSRTSKSAIDYRW